MFGVLGLLMVSIGAAALVYHYGQVQQDIEVVSPIVVTSTPDSILAWLGIETIAQGNDIGMENIAPFDVDVVIENDAPAGIEVRYIGEVELTTKNLETWEATDDLKATIKYTVIGDTFTATGVPEGYTLVYYPNIGDYETWTGYVVKVEGTTESLPHVDDLNAGGSSNYCELNPEATRCEGAKLWLVPSDGFIDENTVDWSRASEILFETELAQYNAGTLTIYVGETFTLIPEYTVNAAAGTYTVTTEVNPIV